MEEKEEEREQKKTQTKRVASLDIFRGLTVAVVAVAAYGAHHLAHGGYHHQGGSFGHHGKFKHGKFGKRWKHHGMFEKHGGKFMKFKKWK